MRGKTLLVPDERVASGTAPQREATARWVPSPPSTMMTATPSDTMRSTASSVSRTLSSLRVSSTSNSGQTTSGDAANRCRARCTAAQMPVSSGIIRTRSTPSAPRAASMRCTMFDFSMVGKTDAWLTSRRMSRPDAGLATIPTVAGVRNDRRIDEALSANSIPPVLGGAGA